MDTTNKGPAAVHHERPPAAVDGSQNMNSLNNPTKFVSAHRRAMSKTSEENFGAIDQNQQNDPNDKVTNLQESKNTRNDPTAGQGPQFQTLQHPNMNKTATTASGESPHKSVNHKYLTNASSQNFRAGQLRGQSGVSIKKRSNQFGSIGMGIVHEKAPSYLNVYINPVFTAPDQKMGRTQSRAMRKRVKRNRGVINGNNTNFIDQKSDADQSFVPQNENEQDVMGEPSNMTVPNRSTNDLSPKTGNAPFLQDTHEGSAMNSSRLQNSVMGTQSVTMAKKLREQKEGDVKKLHNRIALLQAEEEKALKRIEETRYKAQQMLENKMQQEQYLRERAIFKEKQLQAARDFVASKREEQYGVSKQRQMLVYEKNKMQADNVRNEGRKLWKQKMKLERVQLSKARERRIEQQILMEASKIKNEQFLVNRLENQKKSKDDQIRKENKIIMKKEKQSRKLEILEAEVLKRLRDTHIKQQQAIEEIQDIFNNRHSLDPNMQFDQDMMYPTNSQLGGHQRSSSAEMDQIPDMNQSFEDNTNTYADANQTQRVDTHPVEQSGEQQQAEQNQQLENGAQPAEQKIEPVVELPPCVNPDQTMKTAQHQSQESINAQNDKAILESQGNHWDTQKTVKTKKAALIGQDQQDDNISAANQTKGITNPKNVPTEQSEDINSRQNTLGETGRHGTQVVKKKDSKIIEAGEQIVVNQPTEGK